MKRILNNRGCSLILSGVIGICLMVLLAYIDSLDYIKSYSIIDSFLSKLEKTNFLSSIYFLLLSLPTLILLWIFRTHDTKEQINKTQDNIHTSIYLKAVEMLHTEDVSTETTKMPYRVAGLRELILLKKESVLLDSVKNATIKSNLTGMDLSGMDLSNFNLIGANLTGSFLGGANLAGAFLAGANLYRANLCGANLYEANLTEANLCGAKLYDTKLYEANLTGAKLYGANLTGARYNLKTIFTNEFDPLSENMIKVLPSSYPQ